MAMTLRTDEELDNALNELSASQGLSKQEVLRRAVLDWHERSQHRSKVERIADDLVVEYAEALDRLGTV